MWFLDITGSKEVAASASDKSPLVAYKPRPFDCLLGQSLELLESCIVLLRNMTTDADQSFPYSISIDLLSLLCPPVVAYKAKSLLYNSLVLSSAMTKEANQSIVLGLTRDG